MNEHTVAGMNPRALARHLEQSWYGDFELTAAIRPSPNQIIPVEGFRTDVYRHATGLQSPLIVASVTRQKLFNVFMELLGTMPQDVPCDLVLETSHPDGQEDDEGADEGMNAHVGYADLKAEAVDPIVLRSHLWDYEDVLTDDGCAGIAVWQPDLGLEVQFDEHKLLDIYYQQEEQKQRCIDVLAEYEIPHNQCMKILTEGEHLHSTDPALERKFWELARLLGAGNEHQIGDVWR